MSEKNVAEQISNELLKVKTDEKKEGAVQTPTVKKTAKITPKVKSPPIKDKQYYDVKVETMLPATITFRILAESPEQAADLIKGRSPIEVKHRLFGRKDLSLKVFKAGTNWLEWAKKLVS